MKMKRIVSLTALLSLFIVILTSVILYIVPQGRVAYWANWQLWGMSKEQWSAIHINVGILFLISMVLHIYSNWSNITLYLKNRGMKLRIFTMDFNAALVLILLFVVGTYAEIPPFSTIIEINGQIKDQAAQKYGEPPYGHAELSSLKSFARHMGIDLKGALQALMAEGYVVVSDSQTLKEVAVANGVAPQKIYLAMTGTSIKGETGKMPRKPVQGMGKLTLLALCRQYGLEMEIITNALKENNINFEQEMNLKQIAELNGLRPIDVYGKIREAVDSKRMM